MLLSLTRTSNARLETRSALSHRNTISNHNEQEFPQIVKSSQEKTDEKVSICQLSKYQLPINGIHIQKMSSEMIILQHFG
jgi:hypothetical protein